MKNFQHYKLIQSVQTSEYTHCLHVMVLWREDTFLLDLYVTEFEKRGLIHASDFPTLTRHNFICKQAIKLQFSVLLVQ